MSEHTLESLARRLEALERVVQTGTNPPKDWRRAFGTIADSEFARQVDAEGQAIREAERAAARLAAEMDSPVDESFTVDVPTPVPPRRRPAGVPAGMDWRIHLASDPRIMCGKLCARGTRIPVTTLLDCLAEGASREEVLTNYPSVRPEHIDAALAYAAELARGEDVRNREDREVEAYRNGSL